MRKGFYQKKAELLEELIASLKEARSMISYGDPDGAIRLESKNEKILARLEKLDREQFEDPSSEIPCQSDILQSERVFSLLDEARKVQIEVEAGLKVALEEARQEYTESSVKRQIFQHLHRTGGALWTKNFC